MGEEVLLYSLLLLGVIWISGNAERTQKIVNSIKKKKKGKRRAQCSGGNREWVLSLVALFRKGISNENFYLPLLSVLVDSVLSLRLCL